METLVAIIALAIAFNFINGFHDAANSIATVVSTRLLSPSASATGAATTFPTTDLGIPVFTTHTIAGSIVGTGTVGRSLAVRWGAAGRTVWARVLTVPGVALISASTYLAVTKLGFPR